MKHAYKSGPDSELFFCDGCVYNNDNTSVGCGGHCLKQIQLSSKESAEKVMMKLVIAEKPSQAMAFAKVLGAKNKREGYLEGNGWVVSWCLGHLLRLSHPDEINPELKKWRVEDLPVIPEKWSYVQDEGKKQQLQRLKKLMNDPAISSVVCATDAGREGELIFRLVYEWANCQKPTQRLWISSMEPSAIAEGFANLRPGSDFDNLYQAALCRSRADWLIGINETRKLGALCHRNVAVGRVLSPTLAMVVERSREIEAFESVPFYTVTLTGKGFKAESPRMDDKDEADALAQRCSGAPVTVKEVKAVQKSIQPPLLYDLTTLQREANRHFGYTAKEVLETAQALYEKRLLSYPRTDSRYITEDMVETVVELAHAAAGALNVLRLTDPDTKRLADNSKVSDHYALLPTRQISRKAMEGLDEMERNVMTLVLQRLLCAASKPYLYEETTLTLECCGTTFTAKGKRVVDAGWKALEGAEESEVANLPALKEGQVLNNLTASRSDHKTTPPKQHTEDTLLSAMEHAANGEFAEDVERSGLGTPATRAGIMEKLVSSGYVVRKGKQLVPTEAGKLLVSLLPEKLRSPTMTAQWENDLLRIQRGEVSPRDFMHGIEDLTLEIIAQEPDQEAVKRMTYAGAQEVGNCPRCGEPVYEQPRGYFCSGCDWALWKNSGYLNKAGIELDTQLAKALIADGHAHVDHVHFIDEEHPTAGTLYLIEMGGKCPSFKYKLDEEFIRKGRYKGYGKTKSGPRRGTDGAGKSNSEG